MFCWMCLELLLRVMWVCDKGMSSPVCIVVVYLSAFQMNPLCVVTSD